MNYNISKNLIKFREANNYSQEYVSASIGINQGHYSRLEAGTVTITLEILEKLAQFYKVCIEKLIQEYSADVSKCEFCRHRKDK